ncbi:MAG: hypothetical protein H6566_24805 [Lewinellaceae bacterium]|nr:hypothetical protein [Lewinellaceae bacterium]
MRKYRLLITLLLSIVSISLGAQIIDPLEKEYRKLLSDQAQLKIEIAELTEKRNALAANRDFLQQEMQQLVQEKQKMEEKISEKEELLATVSEAKQRAEEVAQVQSQRVKQLDRKVLENENVLFAKEAELAKATLEAEQATNRQKQLIILSGFGTLFALLLLVLFLVSRRSRNKLLRQKRQIESQHMQLLELDNYKNSLLKGIYHDLRFPVSSIKELCRQATREASLDSTVAYSNLISINEISNYLITLSETVLTIERSKQQEFLLEALDHKLSEAVRDAINQLNAVRLRGNIVYSNEVSQGLYAKFDYTNIVRVFVNLISNAEKAIDQRMARDFSFIEGKIAIQAIDEGQWVRVNIVDNGLGMDKQIVSSLLNDEPLKSNSSDLYKEIEPTGIGFSFCKKIVELHDQEIGIQSSVGEGTTISFFLEKSELEWAVDIGEDENQVDYGVDGFIRKISKEFKAEAEELAKIGFHQFTRIEQLIEQISRKANSKEAYEWKKIILEALYTRNQARFKALSQL